jgi:hypothetical protein
MALAIRFDALVREGAVSTQAELAAVGHVTRARVTQIMNLLHLAPDLQECILFLPQVRAGKDPFGEHQLRPLVSMIEWESQRAAWRVLSERRNPTPDNLRWPTNGGLNGGGFMPPPWTSEVPRTGRG